MVLPGGFGMMKTKLINFLLWAIIQIHCLFDCLVDTCFGFYYKDKSRKVPPVKNELLLESGVSLARKIREGKLSSEEVVKAFIERCKDVNEMLNAVVDERYEDAIKDAKEVDEFLKGDVDREMLELKRPFLGVPFTTKEGNQAKGMKHSMGLLSRKGHIATEDATVIANFKEAGGILIAKTNIPEMCAWIESRNNVYGQTNNPYNTTRTVGGSGGGDGALLGACGTPIAIGSDLGGSVRIPAFYNGVYGHKPSGGATSIKGLGMKDEDCDNTIIESGPMCKKAEDLLPLLKVLAGGNALKLKLDTLVDLKNLSIFYQTSLRDLTHSPVSPVIHYNLMKAVDHFEEITGSATEVKMPGSEYSYKIWRYWKTRDIEDFSHDLMNRKGHASPGKELWNLLTMKSEFTLATIILLFDLYWLPQENEEFAKSATTAMKTFLIEKLGDNGVLFLPALPNRVPYHFVSYFKPFNFSYLGLFNVLELPSCSVPLGFDEDGLPVGIQIVAGPGNDHLCLAVARELERVFGGYVPPS